MVELDGAAGQASGLLLHEPRQSLFEYVHKRNLYSEHRARFLHEHGARFRLHRLLLRPPLAFAKSYRPRRLARRRRRPRRRRERRVRDLPPGCQAVAAMRAGRNCPPGTASPWRSRRWDTGAESPAVQIAAAPLHSRQKLVVDIATTFGARFAAVPLALVSSVLLARSLHPRGRACTRRSRRSADLSLVLGTLGISTAAVYYLAQPSEDLERTRATVLGLCFLIGAAVTCAFLIAAGVGLAGGSTTTGWALVAIAPIGIISLGRAALESFFRAQHQIRTINVAAVTSSAAFFC